MPVRSTTDYNSPLSIGIKPESIPTPPSREPVTATRNDGLHLTAETRRALDRAENTRAVSSNNPVPTGPGTHRPHPDFTSTSMDAATAAKRRRIGHPLPLGVQEQSVTQSKSFVGLSDGGRGATPLSLRIYYESGGRDYDEFLRMRGQQSSPAEGSGVGFGRRNSSASSASGQRQPAPGSAQPSTITYHRDSQQVRPIS